MPLSLSFNPIWSMVDLTGLQLNSNYYLFTLQNTLPYLYSPIYQGPDFSDAVWSDPIQFLANGTLPYNMYFDESLVYRLEVRMGPTQSDPLIYLVENYVPNSTGISPIPPGAASSDNQLSNPQFAAVYGPLSTTPLTSTASVINFAPDWQIVTTGSAGSVTISQIFIDGAADILSNPSYGIQIVSSGWDTITLQQTFSGNGALWAGQSAAVSICASSSITGTLITGNLLYSNSVITVPSLISAALNTTLTDYTGAASIDASTNTNPPSTASTIFQLTWLAGQTIQLTSLQLVGDSEEIPYIQTTLERQLDQNFHYYYPQLSYKPIPSYLVGWDFALNPCQELGTTPTAVTCSIPNGSYYVADQTILFQTVDASFPMAQTATGMTFTASNTSSFALIQYLPAKLAVEILNQRNSMQLQAYSNQAGLTGTVSIAWTAGALPTLPISTNFLSLVTGITAGVPTLVNTWSFVPRGQLAVNAPFTLGTTASTFNFNQFDATAVAAINTATYLAVIICFNTVTINKTVSVNYCSFNGGDIASRPAAQSLDQVLDQCEHYYEKSYATADLPAKPTTNNAITAQQTVATSSNSAVYPNIFSLEYNRIKRSTSPMITLYSTAGTAATVSILVTTSGDTSGLLDAIISGNWTVDSLGSKGTIYVPANNNPLATCAGTTLPRGWIEYQYVADARIGQV